MTVDQIREKYYSLKAKEDGMKEGEYNKSIEIAINFLKLGISPEIVAQGTGFSLDEINKIKEGLKEGLKEGIRKTAVNLLKMGMANDIVAQGTGLSLEEVEKIKREMEN